MNPNIVTASRIKQLREKMNLNQSVFAERFSDFANRPNTYSVMTISCWETGRKLPPADVVLQLATFFGVTTDYLFGLSDEEDVLSSDSTFADLKKVNVQIKYKDMYKHDGEPVFVQFPNNKYKNQWALLDYNSKILIFKTFKLQLTPTCNYFYAMPPEEITIKSKASHLLNLKSVMKMERVYIESTSPDPFIQGRISGWYKNSVDHEFLINEKGQTLSYEGLGETYNAIDFKSTEKIVGKE